MNKLYKRYRRDYTGEKISISRVYENLTWQDETEWVPSAVTNDQISNQAVILGNGLSRLDFNLNLIKNHRGGLLGRSRLQSYGCNALYQDFAPDFLVASGAAMIAELARSSYVNDNIVYTHPSDVLEYPTKFYITPHDPFTDAGTTATYIAAFDGHKKIFLLGFDGQDTPGFNNNVYADRANYTSKHFLVQEHKWANDMKQVMMVYNDVDFIKVTKKGRDRTPESWKYISNFRQINYNDFSLEANL